MFGLKQSISQWLSFPSICLICFQYHNEDNPICACCHSLLLPLASVCIHCAVPIPEGGMMKCGQCAVKPPPIHRTYVRWQYEEPLRGLLHQYKYGKSLELTQFFAHLMALALPNEGLERAILIPVPLHPKRLAERGFNQSLLLAKALSKKINCSVNSRLITKIKHTPSQATLKAEARRHNLKNAFEMNGSPPKHVLLVDDLITTGETAFEIARMLISAGVERVDLVSCARACAS